MSDCLLAIASTKPNKLFWMKFLFLHVKNNAKTSSPSVHCYIRILGEMSNQSYVQHDFHCTLWYNITHFLGNPRIQLAGSRCVFLHRDHPTWKINAIGSSNMKTFHRTIFGNKSHAKPTSSQLTARNTWYVGPLPPQNTWGKRISM